MEYVVVGQDKDKSWALVTKIVNLGSHEWRMFRNMIRFYGEDFLAPRPTPELEDYTLSAVRNSLFNIFATTLHTGGRSSIRNLRTRHCRGDRDPGIDGRLILRWIFRKWDVGSWTGLSWLRIGTGNGHV
jgi:hypothetical protein